MRRWLLIAPALPLAFVFLFGRIGGAAEPNAGTVSSDNPSATWQSKTFVTSNPTGVCVPADPACDTFALTIAQPLPSGDYKVTVAIDGKNDTDDYDLYVHGPDGEVVDQSATPSGNEAVTLTNPAPGTYEVVVIAWLVAPTSTFAGKAELGLITAVADVNGKAKAFKATPVTKGSYGAGAPVNEKVSFPGEPLKVQTTYVGRESAEPTLGVTKNGTAFFAAATFDAVGGALARTEIMRSQDDGKSWTSVQKVLLADVTTEPPTTLDPYVHVDPVTGRVFSIDLYVGCAHLLFSDDEGQTWTRNPIACGQPVNDHHTITTAPPAPGTITVGYPNVVYYCFNRVSDSSCGKSLDGGLTFVPAGTAFLGVDPEVGGFCGGLHGHLAADSNGRLFVPKGHCGFPWISISEDGGTTFTRVQISDAVPVADHEVSLAVDAANNVYAVWFDGRDRLPYLAVSKDHGRTWSTPVMVAPPGVHEVNFPTIAAGDAGRVAIHFPGTTSANRVEGRQWNSYELVTTNALAIADTDPQTNAVFVFTTANDPKEPIHRGDCGPGRCGGMLDFLDIQISPKDGAFWAAGSDTYVDGADLRPGHGFAVRQTGGPSLRARD